MNVGGIMSIPTTDCIFIQPYDSPCGRLMLGSYSGQLCLCSWVVERHRPNVEKHLQKMLKAPCKQSTTEVIEAAQRQLDEYFSRKRQSFHIPLLFVGTAFQEKVWRALLAIPFGVTVSYADIARQIGMPKAVRAVANANRANVISIFVPCHRVIGSDGSLTGYGGGLPTKNFLLELEAKQGFLFQ